MAVAEEPRRGHQNRALEVEVVAYSAHQLQASVEAVEEQQVHQSLASVAVEVQRPQTIKQLRIGVVEVCTRMRVSQLRTMA